MNNPFRPYLDKPISELASEYPGSIQALERFGIKPRRKIQATLSALSFNQGLDPELILTFLRTVTKVINPKSN